MASATTKTAPTDSSKPTQNSTATPQVPLEEDDEFEDFPTEDWPDTETDAGAAGVEAGKEGAATGPVHLWEESWDDDDTSEDFAEMLREELKKVEASKR